MIGPTSLCSVSNHTHTMSHGSALSGCNSEICAVAKNTARTSACLQYFQISASPNRTAMRRGNARPITCVKMTNSISFYLQWRLSRTQIRSDATVNNVRSVRVDVGTAVHYTVPYYTTAFHCSPCIIKRSGPRTFSASPIHIYTNYEGLHRCRSPPRPPRHCQRKALPQVRRRSCNRY